jgi:hypothetical protein
VTAARKGSGSPARNGCRDLKEHLIFHRLAIAAFALRD